MEESATSLDRIDPSREPHHGGWFEYFDSNKKAIASRGWNLLNRALLCHQKLKETNNKSPTSNYPGKEVESELIALTGESGKTQYGMAKFTGLNLY